MQPTHRNTRAAIALFFTAPLVAEFLLGNLGLKLLPALIVLAPMYGGGALLIRELVRRTSRGWPTFFLLGAAYALIEEGFITQSLFNADYLHMHMHLLDHAYLPALGIGVWWTLFMFNLHTFWSMAVSIALIEALYPAQNQSPWLGRIGTSVAAVLFAIGLSATFRFNLKSDPFTASHRQFLATAVACLVFIALAFLLPRAGHPVSNHAVPDPWLTGSTAFLLGFAVLITPLAWPMASGWAAVALLFTLDLIFLIATGILSRSSHWTPLHTASLSAGGALAYGIHAFIEKPVAGGSGALARAGNVFFLALALALITAGIRHTRRASSLQISSQPIGPL